MRSRERAKLKCQGRTMQWAGKRIMWKRKKERKCDDSNAGKKEESTERKIVMLGKTALRHER